MRILVAGGGISGLATAIFLHRNNHRVTLIEKSHSWKNIGYVIFLWQNGMAILKKLGVYEQILASGSSLRKYILYNKFGTEVKTLNFDKLIRQFGPIVSIERETLHTQLRSLSSDIPTKFDTTVRSLNSHSNGVDVILTDNTKGTFDIVIGSDGVHSRIRDEVFRKDKIEYYNWAMWMAWVTKIANMSETNLLMFGRNKIFSVYPVPTNKYCGIFNLHIKHGTPDKAGKRVELLRHHFGRFGGFMPTILDNLTDPIPIYHDDITKVNMHDWYKDRIVLVGDAEHAMSPLLGMGISMALEDAYVLTDQIEKSKTNISQAFQNYARIRQPRLNLIQYNDRKIWKLINFLAFIPESLHKAVVQLIPDPYFTGFLYQLMPQVVNGH